MRPIRKVALGPRDVEVERRAGGAIVLRSPHALGPYPAKLTERLEHRAQRAPDRVLFAQRQGDGWRRLTYREAVQRARRVGQFLLKQGLSAERPLVVLSGNDIEHALLHLGAMYVGIPYAPVSPAYSLLSADFGKLRAILDLLTPGLVFVSQRSLFEKALGAVVRCEIIDTLEEPAATAAVDAAHARVGPDTIAKFLFTSGSTGMPKAVVNTQRMWCANQAMIQSMLAFLADEPPVLLDWAPWHHTAAGNHDFGLAIYNGGSYYIDEGKPLPGAIEATVRNLREVAPTWYFNVPKGFEMLLPFLRKRFPLAGEFFLPAESPVVRGRGAAAACFRRDEGARLRHLRRGDRVPHRLRRHRDRPRDARPRLAVRERRQHGPAAGGSRGEAGTLSERL